MKWSIYCTALVVCTNCTWSNTVLQTPEYIVYTTTARQAHTKYCIIVSAYGVQLILYYRYSTCKKARTMYREALLATHQTHQKDDEEQSIGTLSSDRSLKNRTVGCWGDEAGRRIVFLPMRSICFSYHVHNFHKMT